MISVHPISFPLSLSRLDTIRQPYHRFILLTVCSIYSSASQIGGHGAGLTNMIFADNDTTIIEFAMNPHLNRCFGFMAMALGMDYWLVPQLSSFYYGKYNATNDNVAAVIRLLRYVIRQKSWHHLLRSPVGQTLDEVA